CGREIEVPGGALGPVCVLYALLPRHLRCVVAREVDGQDVAVRGLPRQALLRRNASARFGGRVVKPHAARAQKDELTDVTRRSRIAHEVSELARLTVDLRVHGQDDGVLALTLDVLDQGELHSERLLRVANLIGGGDYVTRGLPVGKTRGHDGEHGRDA